jgi:hypothetical protein
MTTTEVTTTVVVERGALDWITAVGTIGAVVVALLLGLGLVEWWRRPKLKLEISDAPFDRVTTRTVAGPPAAYLRARVANQGRSAAKNVNVAILSVAEWQSGAWRRVKPELDGRPLAWSNTDPTAQVDIPAKAERPFDVISVVRDWTTISVPPDLPIRVEIRGPFYPANEAHVLSPGAWRIQLEVSAEHVSAKGFEVVAVFPGFWPADPPERVWEVINVEGPAKLGSISSPPEPSTELQELAEEVFGPGGFGGGP